MTIEEKVDEVIDLIIHYIECHKHFNTNDDYILNKFEELRKLKTEEIENERK